MDQVDSPRLYSLRGFPVKRMVIDVSNLPTSFYYSSSFKNKVVNYALIHSKVANVQIGIRAKAPEDVDQSVVVGKEYIGPSCQFTSEADEIPSTSCACATHTVLVFPGISISPIHFRSLYLG